MSEYPSTDCRHPTCKTCEAAREELEGERDAALAQVTSLIAEREAMRKVCEALAPKNERWTDARFRNAHTIDIITRKDGKTYTYEGDWLKDVGRALVPCVRCAQGFKIENGEHVYWTSRGDNSFKHTEPCRALRLTNTEKPALSPGAGE